MRVNSRKVADFLSKILLVVFFVSCSLLILSLYRTYKVKQTDRQLSEIRVVVQEQLEEKDWSNGMLELNPDYAGWLKVYETGVDNPVVLGETNDTYLRRDFYGKWSIAGTLFFDETTDFEQQGNRIIYGHMMKDDTMFGGLVKFKNKDFFKENGYVRLEDINGIQDYKIFAALVVDGNVDSPDFIDLQKWNNVLSEEETEEMLRVVEDRASIYQKPLKRDGDTYLFLVTCDFSKDNGRLVLVARSIQEQEKIENK